MNDDKVAALMKAGYAAYEAFENLEGDDGGWSFSRLNTRMEDLFNALSDLEDTK